MRYGGIPTYCTYVMSADTAFLTLLQLETEALASGDDLVTVVKYPTLKSVLGSERLPWEPRPFPVSC